MRILKFMVDVNVEKTIVDFLRDEGYDVISIPTFDRKMHDESLLKLANKERRIRVEVIK